jgi:hypothetical protein
MGQKASLVKWHARTRPNPLLFRNIGLALPSGELVVETAGDPVSSKNGARPTVGSRPYRRFSHGWGWAPDLDEHDDDRSWA